MYRFQCLFLPQFARLQIYLWYLLSGEFAAFLLPQKQPGMPRTMENHGVCSEKKTLRCSEVGSNMAGTTADLQLELAFP